MFERIRRHGRRKPAVRPMGLPPTVKFDVIDYEGERLYLAVPIEAVVMIEEDNDVLLLSEEAFVYGIGPTLEDAMEDFCGSFIVCYDVMLKYGPGNNRWGPIMRHLGYPYGE